MSSLLRRSEHIVNGANINTAHLDQRVADQARPDPLHYMSTNVIQKGFMTYYTS